MATTSISSGENGSMTIAFSNNGGLLAIASCRHPQYPIRVVRIEPLSASSSSLDRSHVDEPRESNTGLSMNRDEWMVGVVSRGEACLFCSFYRHVCSAHSIPMFSSILQQIQTNHHLFLCFLVYVLDYYFVSV